MTRMVVMKAALIGDRTVPYIKKKTISWNMGNKVSFFYYCKMSNNEKVVVSQPKAGGPSAPAGQNPAAPEEKTFFQKFGGLIIQIIFFWLVMKTISGGKISLYITRAHDSHVIY
jgi:hypothetical protein